MGADRLLKATDRVVRVGSSAPRLAGMGPLNELLLTSSSTRCERAPKEGGCGGTDER